MQEFFEALQGTGGKNLAPILAILITGIAVVAVTWITHWHKHRKAEMDAALKHEMIERGMSAEDIERVLAAGTEKPHKGVDEPARKKCC